MVLQSLRGILAALAFACFVPALAAAPNKPPVVGLTAPTSGASFTSGSNITLTATATDSNDTIAKVDFYANGSPIGTATTSPYTITWSNVAANSYSLTAKATDSRGAATTSSAVSITVTGSTDQPPTVTITSPANNALLATPASFTIMATANDSDGTISKVVFYDGTTALGTVTGSTATLNASMPVSNLAAGAHVLTAIATDNAGINTTSAPVSITLDMAPVVTLTSPGACLKNIVPATVTLKADVADPDGAVVSVKFYANGTLLFTDTSNAVWKIPGVLISGYQWANAPIGTYALTAVATDNLGLSTTSSPVTIAVTADQPPNVSITSPSDGSSITAGTAMQVVATSIDDGAVDHVDFYANGTLIGTAPYRGYQSYLINWTPTTAGTVALTAVATDNAGLTTTSAPIQLNVLNAHPAPTVSLSVATDTNPAYAPALLHLTATASADTGLSIGTIAFYNGTTLIGTGSATNLDWLAHTSGSYSLTAVATDSTGEATTSTPVTVSLNPSTVTYIHTDLLGSPIVGTNESGTVAWKAHYAPFGERLDSNNTERLGYTGQPFDNESGLAYHGARYYDATIGRFYGIDSVDVNPGDIHSFNRYAYADNNPFAKYDRSGLYTCADDGQGNCLRFATGLVAIGNIISMNPYLTVDEQQRLGAILQLYGNEGDPGVNVSFAASPGFLGVADYHPLPEGDSITFSSDPRPDLAFYSTIIHEGQHAVDDSNRGSGLRSYADRYLTEHNAYTSQAMFNRASNGSPNFELLDGSGGYDQQAIENAVQGSISGACGDGNGGVTCDQTQPPQDSSNDDGSGD